jgi:membrane protease YdiL (CAAX protease family)
MATPTQATLPPTFPAVATATRGTVPLATAVALLATLVGSALPLIAWREATGTATPPWLLAGQAGAVLALWAVAARVPALAPARPLLPWVLGMTVGWHAVIHTVVGGDAWQAWKAEAPFAAYRLAYQALIAVPTALLLLLVARQRLGPRALRLAGGQPAAPAPRDPLLLNPVATRWSVLAPLLGLAISGGTLIAMYAATRPDAAGLARLLPALPAVLLAAALNTLQEEFQFRNLPLALGVPALGAGTALALTSLYFGLAHFYGNPPAYAGVAMASWLGYVLGRSILATGDSRWAWAIHFAQDVIIFSFLAMAWHA